MATVATATAMAMATKVKIDVAAAGFCSGNFAQMKLLTRAIWIGCTLTVPELALAAEVQSSVSVPVGVGYTDNAELKPNDQKRSDFFWRVSPGLSLVAKGPSWNSAISYTYLWEKHSKDDRHNANQNLNALFRSEVVDNLFFFDANAAINQVRENYLDPVGFDAQNLNDVFTWEVRPALKRQFANSSRAELAVSAYGVSGQGTSAYSNGLGHRARATYSSGGIMDSLRFDFSALDDRFQYDQLPYASAVRDNTVTQSISLRSTLTSSRKITPYVAYGYENIEDITLRREPTDTFWNAGFLWIPSARTRLDANFGKRFFGDTRDISFNLRARNTNWNLSYVQDLRTGQQDFLIPESVAAFNRLNSGLQTIIPDAAQRASFISALLQSQGLPPVSILATRNYVDKNLSGNVSYATSKSTTLFNLYWRDSDASEVSLPVPGAPGVGNRTRQKGLNLGWNYRLGINLSSSVNTGYIREQFPDVSINDDTVFGRIGLNYQMSRHFSANTELRRIDKTSNDATREYTENSIVLSLIASF